MSQIGAGENVGVRRRTISGARSSLISQGVQPLQVVFNNLSFTIKKKSRRKNAPPRIKVVLDNISAVFRPGRLTAIMGPSGAGKTSLLDAVAGNRMGGKITGEIKVNGEDFGLKRMREISGFVFQDDVLLASMTSIEAIRMSAVLRLPSEITREERSARVTDMIDVLHLQSCKNTIIGTPEKKGVSGGERKRICTAMELIANPPVLFLDEPTSGLDTFTAYTVVKSLRKLAHIHGRTVVATIHQPSSDIFQLFDDLILLYAGKVVYCGAASNAVSYFERLGYNCPMYCNPADFMFMDVLRPGACPARRSLLTFAREHSGQSLLSSRDSNISHTSEHGSDQAAKSGQDSIPTGDESNDTNPMGPECLAQLWQSSPECQEVTNLIHNSGSEGVHIETLRKRAPWWTQFHYLFVRASKNAFRNPLILRLQAFIAVFLGVVSGLIFIDTGSYKASVRARNFSGVLYFYNLSSFFRAVFGVVNTFNAEKKVFYRDFQAGYYVTAPYFFTKLIVELPIYFIAPYLTIIIGYYMIGLDPAFSSYLMISTLVAFSSMCGVALGLLLGSMFDDFRIVLAITPVILMPLLLFSGIFVAANTLPGYLNWIKYVSPIYWGFIGCMQVQFSGDLDNCDPSSETCRGPDILKNLGLVDLLPVGVDLVFQATLLLAYIILGYIVLEGRVRWRFRQSA